ncbi:hypothetical protein [Lentzea sp. NPDC059081]|uniref:hypothetical protein n=1 Tax=Lentzea sp. NPDC059081 TaxID=3346719 RepID=UPI0036A3AB44
MPLIGSTSQRLPDVPILPGLSSPCTPSSGTASASRARIRSSTARSVGVTSLPSSLYRTSGTPATSVSSAASRTIRSARHMSVHMSSSLSAAPLARN